jgi:hypothetical protein
MDKETKRGAQPFGGRSRTQARRNKAMRKVLLGAFDRLLEECLRTGWFGEIALQAHVENGILQREYTVQTQQTYRTT